MWIDYQGVRFTASMLGSNGDSWLCVGRSTRPGSFEAVERSIPAAPQLRRWLNWKGEPTVSIAASLDRNGVTTGRLYNFLPMGPTAVAPVAGYLDAPFFTDIDRRTAKTDLPLNDVLITAAAEACAAAAISIVENRLHIPPRLKASQVGGGVRAKGHRTDQLKRVRKGQVRIEIGTQTLRL